MWVVPLLLVLSLPQEHAEMGATHHLDASSEIFTVLRNIVTLVVINMYSISAGMHISMLFTVGISINPIFIKI